MQLPDRSTLAAGLASVIGWAIVTFGVPALCVASSGILCVLASHITTSEMVGAVGAMATLASQFTPDSIKDIAVKLNTDVKSVVSIMPVVQDTYPPDGKSNI